MPDSYYVRLDARRFASTRHTEGAWQPGEQHMAPVAGLIVHAIEGWLTARGDDGLLLSRITFEILGMIAQGECDIEVTSLRPGRTIELLEATLTIAGRPVVRARAWRLVRVDTSAVAGGAPDPLPAPDSVPPWDGMPGWPGDYIRSLEFRPVGERLPGRGVCWLRTAVDLVADEPVSDLARFVGLVDTANGVAVRGDPRAWMFPNVELTIHLERRPRWGWVGLDTTVIFGADGVGRTSSVLHDEDGPVGRAEQLLTVRPLV